MPQGLIIVESPAKARTLKRFLKDRYDVQASMGHVRDLPEKVLAVDVEHDFKPLYEVVDSKRQTISDLKRSIGRNKSQVILASDPDREGEAIAWHLSEVLGLKEPRRIEFHEITSQAVERALQHPRTIDMRLVDAQQARRVVDRLVGYRLSPFLWSKVQKGIGAGRVQSVALNLVCQREEEIRRFIPEESWTVDALLAVDGEQGTFKARAVQGPEGKLDLKSEAEAKRVLEALEGVDFVVAGVEKKHRSKSPAPAYITSTLQQDASSRLRFAPRKTMKVAQDLYEGVELGAEGPVGLITYMRTDSSRVSEEAEAKVKELISEGFGSPYLGGPRKDKVRPGAQEAHEAIRPTDPARRPEDVRAFLSSDQFRLYDLIWRRFVASRMAAARYGQTSAQIQAGRYELRASGSVLEFDGFYRVWEREADDEEARLPQLVAGQALTRTGLEMEQHFTQPPARYTEATLINELEKRGIGRPSTYANIVGTIQEHRYVEQKERRLHPTELGEAVNKIMAQHFPTVVDEKFTAQMETQLDQVEQGQKDWVRTVRGFYEPLEDMLEKAEAAMPADTGEVCPECHEGHLVLKASRYGPFKGCSRYPKCRYRENLTSAGAAAAPELLEETCPQCGRPLQRRKGRFGEFVGCSGYPECRYIKREERASAEPTGTKCPKCGEGELVRRQGRYGPFLSCSRYPACDYRANETGAARQAPQVLDEKCPVCGKPLVLRRGRFGLFKSCSDYPSCRGPQQKKTA